MLPPSVAVYGANDMHRGDTMYVNPGLTEPKEIPLAKAFAVFVPGTLALIRRRGGTPEKRDVVHVAHESPFYHSTRWIRVAELRLR